jgi:NADPH:quinone reductase-like Zn-dependent oxidoreductase
VEATTSGGLLIVYGALSRDPTVVPLFPIFARNLTIRGLALTTYTADDIQLAALKRFVTEGLADGSLSPVIARTFPFDEIIEAHRFIEAGSQIGKIVVTNHPNIDQYDDDITRTKHTRAKQGAGAGGFRHPVQQARL